MNEVIVINGQNVEFEAADSGVFAASFDIAAVFEKRHDNIISQIRALPNDKFRYLNFKETERTAKFGVAVRSEPYYKITRDGFSLLVMGFTGEKAYRWKIEFINAFNKMEAMIRNASNTNSKALDIIASAMQTMLNQNSTILELLKQKNEPFALCDKPTSRVYHKRLSNEEKFIEKVIAVLKKEEGIKQGELLARVGTYKNNRSALNWLHSYDGIYWRANLLDAGKYTYSYSLIEE
jgi:phage regulatory protein, rha family|nr:MAG TPA: regulatory protein [Caudoviricetes sp.]